MSKSNTTPPTSIEIPTTSLAHSAMLVNLDVRAWQGRKTDRRATREFNKTHEAAENAGEYRKRLLGECGPLKEVLDIAAESNRKHRELTLPWTDDGRRVLASSGFFAYTELMTKQKYAFDKAYKTFLREYPALTVEARKQLGTLYLVEDYPTPKEMATKFSLQWRLEPLPMASDFRVNLRDDEVSQIRAQIEQNLKGAFQNAMADAYSRVAQVVEHMIERLKAYRVNGDGMLVGKFHDTIVTNIEELADLLPKLDFTGGTQLADLAKNLKAELTEHSAQELRDSKALRQDTIKKAQSILNAVRQVAA